jgi:hypothetical protein
MLLGVVRAVRRAALCAKLGRKLSVTNLAVGDT